MSNPYAILGVSPRATEEEVKTAHRRLVKELHPDLHPGDQEKENRLKEVNAAYSEIMARGFSHPNNSFRESIFQTFSFDTTDPDEINQMEAILRAAGFTSSRQGTWNTGQAARRNVVQMIRVPMETLYQGGTLNLSVGSLWRSRGTKEFVFRKNHPIDEVFQEVDGNTTIHYQIEPFSKDGKYHITNLPNISMHVEVDLFDCLVGKTTTVIAPDGDEVSYPLPKNLSNTPIEFPGRGFHTRSGRVGSFYVYPIIICPEITDAQRALLSKAIEKMRKIKT